jgi:hypothetical protein
MGPKLKTASGHIDFAVSQDEIKVCARCGRMPDLRDVRWDDFPRFTRAGRYPLGGLVGICSSCGYFMFRAEVQRRWRETAPACIQLVPGMPVQLVVRRACDDKALAQFIRETIEKVPASSWNKILGYVMSGQPWSVTGKGMRFEALGRWPGMGDCAGMNMDRGHVIRLRASYVRDSLNEARESLSEVILHELAHTEQRADGRSFESSDQCERDVEERLHVWGIDSVEQGKKAQKAALLDHLGAIVELAETAQAKVRQGKLPSGNYALKAANEAERACNYIDRASRSWEGVDWPK